LLLSSTAHIARSVDVVRASQLRNLPVNPALKTWMDVHIEGSMTARTGAKPTVSRNDKGKKEGAWPNEGEGNKSADRRYRKATEDFVKSGRVSDQAQKAADDLGSPEGDELRQAEEKGRRGRT
jgi:hypothetical protein